MENGILMQYFEWNLPNDGKLWKKLARDAQHLHELGVTAVWIPPATKALAQENQGYATYDLFDLGEFYQKGSIRTKYGLKQQLIKAITRLHQYHISVYFDAVLNHKIGADSKEEILAIEVDSENRTVDISKPQKIEAWTKFTFNARDNKYSSFKWDSAHFSGVESTDKKNNQHIFRIVGLDKYWNKDVDTEKGNFDFLMGADIDHQHPSVVAELNNWGLWMINELNVDGIRLDAIKHISSNFIYQFTKHIRKLTNDKFYFVGEYWKEDLETLEDYLSKIDYSIDLFDVPLHFNFYRASVQKKDFDLRKLYTNTLVENYPTNSVTFVDNHDSQKGSSLESEIEDWFKPMAYACILLRKGGYPCLFFKDYYGGKNQNAYLRNTIKLLLSVRSAFAYGEETLYFNAYNLIGFHRHGDDEHPDSGVVVLISNFDKGNITIHIGKEHTGETWFEVYQKVKKRATVGSDGTISFSVPAQSMTVWIKRKINKAKT